jgi:trimethylamine:corrinoid methyltransferase-like protein
MSKLLDNNPYETWLTLGRPNMYHKAHQKAEEILAGPLVDPLPDSVSRRLDEILCAADKELAEDG